MVISNGSGVHIMQVEPHQMVVGRETARKVVMSKLNGGATEVKVNGVILSIYAPIPNRPKVLRIVTDDGRQTILGDYGTFNPNETNALQTIVAPKDSNWKLHLTDGEKKELAEAEADLESARRLVCEEGGRLDKAKAALWRHLSGAGSTSSAEAEARISKQAETLENDITRAEQPYREARQIEQHALNAFNRAKQHLARIARRRDPNERPTFKAPEKISETSWKDVLNATIKRD